MSDPRPAESTRPNSRALLIEAAFEEFTTKGYEAATVAGIAARAGVTTGAVYAHFAGKLDLLLATVALTPVDQLLRSAGEVVSRPWSEVSRHVVRGLTTRPDRRMLLLLDVIVAARRDPHVAAVLRRGLSGYLDAMAKANDAGAARGLFDLALPSEDLARLFGALNLGMVVYAALEQAPPSEQAFARFADLLFRSPGGGGDEEEPGTLAHVREQSVGAERARRALHDSIVEAVANGHSLRQVGAAANLSHERVRQVLRERGA